MTFNETILSLKKVVVVYCLLLFLLETFLFFGFEPHSHEYYFGYFNQIAVYFLLVAILIVKKKWMWPLGLSYFIYGTIDLLFWDISYLNPLSIVSRHLSSSHSSFEFSHLIYMFSYKVGVNCLHLDFVSKITHSFSTTLILFRVLELLMFVTAIPLFFTNFVRKHYGLPPIFKSKNKN